MRLWKKPALVFLGILLGATAYAQSAAEAGWTFTKIDGSTIQMPGGGDNWCPMSWAPPSVDDGNVYFFATENTTSSPCGSGNLVSIWSQNLKTAIQTQLLAIGDPAPGGVGNFTSLGAYSIDPVIRNGVMTMITEDQSTANYPLGWYTFRPKSAKPPQLVMNYNTPIPNGPFGNAGNGAPTGLSTDGTNVSLEYGSAHLVLIADADGKNLVYPYYNLYFTIPNDCAFFGLGYFFGSSVSGGNVAFGASTEGNGTEDFYVLPTTGFPPGTPQPCNNQYAPVPITGPTTYPPGDPDTNNVADTVSFVLDGNFADYIIRDKNAPLPLGYDYGCVMQQNITGGAPVTITCSNDHLPGLEKTPYQYNYLAGIDGAVAFVAQDQQDSSGNRRTGLYLYRNGKIEKVAASGDTVAGDVISSFYGDYYNITISTTAMQGGAIAFWAATTTGEWANYLAQP
jgi:hypothetical protein